MARIRSLKPEIWLSAQVMNLSHGARLLFIGLITQADDEGKGSSDVRRIKAAIFGGDDVTTEDVRRWLDELTEQDLSVVYFDDKHGYLYSLPSWSSHQAIDRKRESSYPAPTSSTIVRRMLDEPSTRTRRVLAQGGAGMEGRKEGSLGRKEGTYPRAREDGEDPEKEPSGSGDTILASEPIPSGSRAQSPKVLIDNEEMGIQWQRIRAAYPEFTGRKDWLMAEHHARLLVEKGLADTETLLQAVERYAAFVAAGGVSAPQYVLTPINFFKGADEPWRQAWTPPPKKPTRAEARTNKNLDAAAQAREELFGKKEKTA